jgi:hypothetical protein
VYLQKIVLTFYLALSIAGCKDIKLEMPGNDNVLAEFYDKKLLLEDIEGITSSAASEQDSIIILKGFVNNWIKDQLLIKEAEKNITRDIDIEKLVNDYRSSLIQYNYIEQLYNKELDTLISAHEVNEYYERLKQQFILAESIVKYTFIKFSKNDKKTLNVFLQYWNKHQKENLIPFAKSEAVFFQQSADWELINSLLILLPKNSVSESNLKEGMKLELEDNNFKFFVVIDQLFLKSEIPPLEYITPTVKKVILNDRKTELVKILKQTLYDKNLENNNIKTYLD